MKKLHEKVKELFDSKKDQTLFVMGCDKKGNFFYSYDMDDAEIGAGVATILSDWYDDKTKGSRRAAEGIIMALKATLENESNATDEILRKIAPAAAKASLRRLEEIKKEIDNMANDGEDCETCDQRNTCQLPQAIKYRKENGIKTRTHDRRKNKCKNNKDDERGS